MSKTTKKRLCDRKKKCKRQIRRKNRRINKSIADKSIYVYSEPKFKDRLKFGWTHNYLWVRHDNRKKSRKHRSKERIYNRDTKIFMNGNIPSIGNWYNCQHCAMAELFQDGYISE